MELHSLESLAYLDAAVGLGMKLQEGRPGMRRFNGYGNSSF